MCVSSLKKIEILMERDIVIFLKKQTSFSSPTQQLYYRFDNNIALLTP